MKSNSAISRRNFIKTSAAALSFVYLPGIGRVQAQPYAEAISGDYQGRLCYNENPLGPSPKALAAIQDTASLSHRYPDWYSGSLETRIAQYHGVNSNQVCAGAGATEVLRLIADAFLAPGDEMITATPTYFQMASETTANGATVVHVPVDENYVIDLRSILRATSPKTKLISLVNPNNPLGTVVNKANMETFIRSVPKGIVVVVDEAYHDYVHSTDYESCIRFMKEGLPVIVVRTFSKAYGLAGTRIGYSLASP
ncbi:MAG: aminotransferase class I/II-fold pyridoxal phosphate-dependent enzyme, partial [bacterium]